MHERTEAMVNGALMVVGAAVALDTVVVHWVFGWHRLIEGMADPLLLYLELAVVIVGTFVFAIGAIRERRARSTAG